jgi:hypothetical protein
MHYANPDTGNGCEAADVRKIHAEGTCSTTAARDCPAHAERCALHSTAYHRHVLGLWMEARVGRRRLAGDVRGALLRSVQDGHRRPRRADRLLGCRVRVDHAATTVLFGRGRGVSGASGPSVKGPGRSALVQWGGARLSPRHGQGGSASSATPCHSRAARWGAGASSCSASGR